MNHYDLQSKYAIHVNTCLVILCDLNVLSVWFFLKGSKIRLCEAEEQGEGWSSNKIKKAVRTTQHLSPAPICLLLNTQCGFALLTPLEGVGR